MSDFLKPDLCFRGVEFISLDELKKRDVQYILLDLDNTLIDYKKELKLPVIEWVNEAKNNGFNVHILSNTNKVGKVKAVAERLGISFICSARKPLKKGFKKAVKDFNIIPEKTAMVGDQLFTDVIGANGMNMISIYVDPIDKKEHLYTSWKRPIEAWFLKKYKNM